MWFIVAIVLGLLAGASGDDSEPSSAWAIEYDEAEREAWVLRDGKRVAGPFAGDIAAATRAAGDIALSMGARYPIPVSTSGSSPDEEDVPDHDLPADDHPYVPIPGLSPLWPLPKSPRKWAKKSFGGRRPWDKSKPATSHHKGIDIDGKAGDPVLAMTDGTIVGSTGWDGPNTRGVLFQSDGGPVLVFGAVAPKSYPPTGTRLQRGQLIARLGTYPKGDTMLHLELYKVGTRKRVVWPWGKPQPDTLVNPHSYLLATSAT